MNIRRIIVSFLSLPLALAAAPTHSEAPSEIKPYIEQVDRVTFHPSLLPIILKHRDTIGLTAAQVERLKAWREAHRAPMVEAINAIVRKRIEFQSLALDSDVSAATLQARQEEIFALHREVLRHKIACRENMLRTFTEQNWDNLYWVLAGEGMAVPGTMEQNLALR